MSNPGAGFEYPPTEVSWLKRDVLLFANSIGCTADELHFLYVCLLLLHTCPQHSNSSFRNCTQTLPFSLHIPSSSVSYPSLLIQISLLHKSSIQAHKPRSNRLLRHLSSHPNPRCAQTRLQASPRRSTLPHFPQAPPTYIRRPHFRASGQGHWCL